MSLLVYLPAIGLSDVEEDVREAAMRAGRMIVTNYSAKAIDLLLRELEQGMFDPGWRMSGISSKVDSGEEEEVAESSCRALMEVLGVERRDRILSALYLARQDAVNVVRQSSIHIWKALVHNTPRTVREILPELMGQLVKLCSSEEYEQQETATRTTTELCRKFGDKMMREMLPILQAKVASPDARTREGVCLMPSDTMENTTDSQRDISKTIWGWPALYRCHRRPQAHR
ncbi:hypothetical protein BU15DRAFT_78646 [Melanogaster broomeanus]|nr:hypothetical protein BU15DRAFT_78646 [Melanogaster broomeanus]